MSITSEISRLLSAKADLKSAIEAKGVTVSSSATLDDYDTYVASISGGGGSGVLNGTITPTSRVQNFTFDVGTSSTITNLLIVPESETPLKSGGKTFVAGIYTPNDYYKFMGVTSNNAGSSLQAPSTITTGTAFSQSGQNITAYSARTASPAINAGYFETITYKWYAW